MDQANKANSNNMQEYKASELVELYVNRENYKQLELCSFMDRKPDDPIGLPFFNARFARNVIKANAKEGWLEIAALNDCGLFGRPVTTPFYTDKTGKIMKVVRISGEVVIIETDLKGKAKEKLIVKATPEQTKKINREDG